MKKDTIVVYTSIFGNYEGLIPQPKFKGVDYICFTDSNIKSSRWKIIKVDKPFADSTRSARYFKILAHRHLEEYETSIYIDANFLILKNPEPLVKEVLKNSLIAFFDHNKTSFDKRDCIYDEHKALLKWGKEAGKNHDDKNVMQNQMNFLKEEGYPKNNGLISSGVLIRRHHDPKVIALMEHWWRMVQTYSKRDQLSFNYVLWKENFKNYSLLEGDIRYGNNWFYFLGHHKKSYFTKLIKFKGKRFLKKL